MKSSTKLAKKIGLTLLVTLAAGCQQTEEPCRSGVSLRDPVRGIHVRPCDPRAKNFKLSDGSVLCLCPNDVSKLTQ